MVWAETMGELYGLSHRQPFPTGVGSTVGFKFEFRLLRPQAASGSSCHTSWQAAPTARPEAASGAVHLPLLVARLFLQSLGRPPVRGQVKSQKRAPHRDFRGCLRASGLSVGKRPLKARPTGHW
jgi:hypothetical protein